MKKKYNIVVELDEFVSLVKEEIEKDLTNDVFNIIIEMCSIHKVDVEEFAEYVEKSPTYKNFLAEVLSNQNYDRGLYESSLFNEIL